MWTKNPGIVHVRADERPVGEITLNNLLVLDKLNKHYNERKENDIGKVFWPVVDLC